MNPETLDFVLVMAFWTLMFAGVSWVLLDPRWDARAEDDSTDEGEMK